MLFAYRATKEEYFALRALLAQQLEQLAGAPWTFRSAAECACFVLYASEWWRREYAGGPWRWTSILQSLGQPFNLDVLERTAAVERGLRAWGHRPGGQGKRYLGAIIAQGGLPLKLVATGDGSITRLLIRAMRQAQLYGWDQARLESFFEAHELELVQHLRDEDIYRLLGSIVFTVLALRQECRLAGMSNPVEVLDRLQPTWRERFPIAVDDNSAEPLLVGLVQEAAKEVKAVTSFPVVVTRSLHSDSDETTYTLAMSVEMPSSISLAALASFVGLQQDNIPQSFSIDLMGHERLTIGDGRQLLGAAEPAVMLSGRARRIVGDASLREQVLILRALGEDLNNPAEVPGAEALDPSQPWVFVAKDVGTVLAGVGACRVPEDECILAVSDCASVSAAGEDSAATLKGVTRGLSADRLIYQVKGAVEVRSSDGTFLVQTRQTDDLNEQLVWRGTRVSCGARPFPVYRGLPQLCRVAPDGMVTPASQKDIEWVVPMRGGGRIEHPRQHCGPIDAWLLYGGRRQRRFRMVVLPSDARIRFYSGESDHDAAVEFRGWNIVSADAPRELMPRVEVTPGAVRVDLRAEGHPPANLTLSVTWAECPHALYLDLPFPASGGRFSTSDGEVLEPGQTISSRLMPTVHVQVFDRNPEAPRRYSLSVELKDSQATPDAGGRLRFDHSIPIDKYGFGELRLLELEGSLQGMMCQSDQLDARLELRLCASQATIAKLYVTRYDAELERQGLEMALSQASMAFLDPEEISAVRLQALPLLVPEVREVDLAQTKSEGVPTGRWAVGVLAADKGPWLVYPAATSRLQVRPALFAGFTIGAQRINTTKLCPLGEAMAIQEPVSRMDAVQRVVAEMGRDLDHKSWELITRQYQLLSHLPLSAFDYWRAFAKDSAASLAVVLKLSHDIPVLMKRMRDELGVMWELMPRSSLLASLVNLKQSWAKQLKVDPADPVVLTLAEQVFRSVGQSDPLLGNLVELVLFQAGHNRTEGFDLLLGQLVGGARPLVQRLWVGENSMLQRFLLRTHADDRIWPSFGLTMALIRALQESAPQAADRLSKACGKELLWFPTAGQAGPQAKNVKEDVANVPLLTGLLSQLAPSEPSWHTGKHLAQIRQIRNFDRAWFEVGCGAGLFLALMLEQNQLHARGAPDSIPYSKSVPASAPAGPAAPPVRRAPGPVDRD